MVVAFGGLLLAMLLAVLVLVALGLRALRDIAQAMHGTNSFLFLERFKASDIGEQVK